MRSYCKTNIFLLLVFRIFQSVFILFFHRLIFFLQVDIVNGTCQSAKIHRGKLIFNNFQSVLHIYEPRNQHLDRDGFVSMTGTLHICRETIYSFQRDCF